MGVRTGTMERQRGRLAAVGATAVAVMAGFWWGTQSPMSTDQRPSWAGTAGLMAVALGLLVELTGGIGLLRSGGSRWARSAATGVLTPAQRRHALRQIRGGAAVPADELPQLVRVAAQIRAGRWFAAVAAGMTLVGIGGFLLLYTWFAAVAAVVLAAAMAFVCVSVLRDAQAATRFWEQHRDVTARR